MREEWSLQAGRRVVSTLSIHPTSGVVPTGGITSRLLRRVRVGQFAAGLRHTIARYFGADRASSLADRMGWTPRARRRKWQRNDDLFYAELARDYVKMWTGTGEGRDKPTATLAKRRGVTPTLLRSQIHLCRRNGFLTESKQGRAGGVLTAKAQAVLSRKEGETPAGHHRPAP